MNKKEKRGAIIFLVIILIEVICFWGTEIMTLIVPNSYFTMQNIRKDTKAIMREYENSFILNEKAGNFEAGDLGELTIESKEIDGNRCELTLSTYWDSVGSIRVNYSFQVVYERKDNGLWKITSFKPQSSSSAEGLIGSWEGNISHEGDFFTAAYNYDLVYVIESVEGTTVTGKVTAYDRLGTDADDTVAFTGVWTERNCILSIELERPITSRSFGAGALFYDPDDGMLKSDSVSYRKID